MFACMTDERCACFNVSGCKLIAGQLVFELVIAVQRGDSSTAECRLIPSHRPVFFQRRETASL